MWQALGALAGGALSAGGAMLGEKSKDESEILREEPPERKYANSVLQLLSARALSGRKGMADLMEEARLRSSLNQQLGQDRQDMLRRYGMMGVESPGMANRLSEMGTSGTSALMNALNQADLERRSNAVSMVNRLLGENQPYEREKITEAPMKYKMLSSALPTMGGMLGGMGGAKAPTGSGGSTNFTAGQKGTTQLGSLLPGILGQQNSQVKGVVNKGGARLVGNQNAMLGMQKLNPLQFPEVL